MKTYTNRNISRLICIGMALSLAFTACKKEDKDWDATGAFEAEETIVSSQASGELLEFGVEEGQELQANQVVGFVDNTQLELKKKQVLAQSSAIESKKSDVSTQLSALENQLAKARLEQDRIEKLFKAEAIPAKQVDDIHATVELLKSQIKAANSNLNIANSSIGKENDALLVQVDQINDQLAKCKIVNPIKGVVLTKYAEPHEVTVQAKPLYKIADLSELILRVYVSGEQLKHVQVGNKVKVHIDSEDEKANVLEGLVTWISSQSEFTPKTIQTKEERANLVYAVKVKVKNNGQLKIGMYGDISFSK